MKMKTEIRARIRKRKIHSLINSVYIQLIVLYASEMCKVVVVATFCPK